MLFEETRHTDIGEPGHSGSVAFLDCSDSTFRFGDMFICPAYIESDAAL